MAQPLDLPQYTVQPGKELQSSDQDRGKTQNKIENYLAGALGGDKHAHDVGRK
jgi:hypothetical protein